MAEITERIVVGKRIVAERKAFEETAFAQYFLSTIKRNPTPRIADEFVSEGCKTRAEFVARHADGSYLLDTLNAAWWAWSKRGEDTAELERLARRVVEIFQPMQDKGQNGHTFELLLERAKKCLANEAAP